MNEMHVMHVYAFAHVSRPFIASEVVFHWRVIGALSFVDCVILNSVRRTVQLQARVANFLSHRLRYS